MIKAIRHNPATVAAVPAAFGKIYSHAVEVPPDARLLLISGQIGVAADGRQASGFRAQCEQAMANVEALLTAASLGLADVVKVTYFLTRAEDLPTLTELRQSRWGNARPPAVTTLIVAGLARLELLVEIEVMAAGR